MNILNRLQAAVIAILMLGTLTGCGACASACPQKCITPGTPYVINWAHCLQCGRCAEACPADAVRRLHP